MVVNQETSNSLASYRRILQTGKRRVSELSNNVDNASPKSGPYEEPFNFDCEQNTKSTRSRRLSQSTSNAPTNSLNTSSEDEYEEALRTRDDLQGTCDEIDEKKKLATEKLDMIQQSIKELEEQRLSYQEEVVMLEIEQERVEEKLTKARLDMKRLGQTKMSASMNNLHKPPLVPPINLPKRYNSTEALKKPTPRTAPKLSARLTPRTTERDIYEDPFDSSHRIFSTHTDSVLALNMVSSRYAVTASADRTVNVWDMDAPEAKPMMTFRGHASYVQSIVSDMGLHQNIDLDFVDDYIHQTLRPYGQDVSDVESDRSEPSTGTDNYFEDICPFVISGGGDNTVRVWNVKNQNNHQVLEGHSAAVSVVRCDHSTIISGSMDRSIKLWDRETGRCTQTMTGSDGHVRTLQFLSYALISGGGDDGVMRLWDIRSGKYFRTIDAHDKGINTLQFDTEKIVSGGKDGRLRVFELKSGRVMDDLNVGSSVTSLQFYKNKLVFSASNMFPVLYDLNNKCMIKNFSGHTDDVCELQFNKKWLITASKDKTMRLWSL
ncbi:hypothetical protein AKO1_015826 [Acrasis kona]|uniref:Guanine nucleotide-binding protein subunit beta-like protein n=1 Tax=Acrasis kona TaxID=1008807 RepID=A0AAW2ZHC3_9EUKA